MRVSPALRARAFEWLFFALAAGCAWPLLNVRYPPLQDLPQHLAAIATLHGYDDAGLAFARYFEIDLLRTQYLAYYLAADLLAYPLGVEHANRVLVVASMVGTPYALRSLLRVLGRDPRMAVLAFPLSYNAHLILGFFNFLAAIPLMLWGIALAVKQRRQFTMARAVGLSLLTLLCFYTHVVPFAVLGLGAGLVALQRTPRGLWRGLWPLLPATLAGLLWTLHSPAGQATMTAAAGAERGPRPEYTPFPAALAQLPRWLTDVLAGDADRTLLQLWGALVLVAIALGGSLGGALALARRNRAGKAPDSAAAPGAPDSLGRSLTWRLAPLAPLCGVFYFVMPSSYDWIWPISARFPLLACLLAPLLLPRLGSWTARAVLACAIVLSAASFQRADAAFVAFERDEVGAFDAALAHIPPGQKVVGLIFLRGSRNVAFSPFIHYVAYYQARKGGAVMFTFADFPQSPFRFREDNRPPRVPPRWEWKPQAVHMDELGWYDYALVRGGPGKIARPGSGFVQLHRGPHWSVWKRASPGHSAAGPSS